MEEPGKIELLPTLLLLSLILFIIVAGVLVLNQQFNKKLYRQKLDAEQLRSRHQQELLRTSIRVQEEERRRIARNLHDELGAALSMTRMLLVQLEEHTASAEKWNNSVVKIREMTEAALATTRRISHELIPPQLEAFGLVKTLEATIAQINSLSAIAIELDFPEDLPRMALPEELGLYRICMELINNTLKHAQADTIFISLSLKDTNLQLRYADNGIGLPEGDLNDGLGLKNIEARMHAMGGTVTIENREPNGILAIINLPKLATTN